MKGKITTEDILEFATGSRYEPVLGFKLKPTINFQPHPQWLPTASTCANQLYLPVPPDAITHPFSVGGKAHGLDGQWFQHKAFWHKCQNSL